MRKIPFVIILVVFFSLASLACKHSESINTTSINKEVVANSSKDIYIPQNIEDCIIQLDSILDDSTKMEIKEMTKSSFSAEAHLGLGLWIRNNWGLWQGGPLASYFNELGLYHPDEISGIILNCYFNHVKGFDIDLKGEIEKDKLFGLMMETPDKKNYPKEIGSQIKFTNIFDYQNEDANPRVVHVGVDSEKKNYWAYDYNFGWKKIDKKTLDKLKKSKPETRYNIVKSIFND